VRAQQEILNARRPRRRIRIGKREQILRFVFFLRTLQEFLGRVFEEEGLPETCDEQR
jgi:hypothetical protein